jgi:hypothetical protein
VLPIERESRSRSGGAALPGLLGSAVGAGDVCVDGT